MANLQELVLQSHAKNKKIGGSMAKFVTGKFVTSLNSSDLNYLLIGKINSLDKNGILIDFGSNERGTRYGHYTALEMHELTTIDDLSSLVVRYHHEANLKDYWKIPVFVEGRSYLRSYNSHDAKYSDLLGLKICNPVSSTRKILDFVEPK